MPARMHSDLVIPPDKVVSTAKRSRTGGYYPVSTKEQTNPRVFARKLFEDIIAKLASNHIATARLLQNRFSWMLPNENTSKRQTDIFRALRDTPLLVSVADLDLIMDLEPSTIQSPPTPTGHHFYIRSWTLTNAEMEGILNHLSEEDETFEELEQWRLTMNLHKTLLDRGNFLTVRYVGTCASPVRPIDRYMADLESEASGILSEFQRAIEQLYPVVAAACDVKLIVGASLDWAAQLNADEVERVLIEFLDPKTLLNRQKGGFYARYVPFLRRHNMIPGPG
jgi:hypothetical protein